MKPNALGRTGRAVFRVAGGFLCLWIALVSPNESWGFSETAETNAVPGFFSPGFQSRSSSLRWKQERLTLSRLSLPFTPTPEGSSSSVDIGLVFAVGSIVWAIVDTVMLIISSAKLGLRESSIDVGIAGVVISGVGLLWCSTFLALFSFFAIIPAAFTAIIHVASFALGWANLGVALSARAAKHRALQRQLSGLVQHKPGGLVFSF